MYWKPLWSYDLEPVALMLAQCAWSMDVLGTCSQKQQFKFLPEMMKSASCLGTILVVLHTLLLQI